MSSPNDFSSPSSRPEFPRREVYRSRAQREKDQALADWFGVSPHADRTQPPMSLDQVLSQLLSKISVNVQQYTPEELNAHWRNVAGDFLGNNAELAAIKNGVAYVNVLQPAMRYHMLQWKNVLLEKLQKEFGDGVIKSISFRIK
jgi:hypothetical protein